MGAGVLGPVFRGYDPEQDRAVAIKALSLDLTPEQARDLAADLGRLPGLPLNHPSIITPLAAGSEGSVVYLVQDYFVAESADVAIKQYGPAPAPDAMRLIGQLAGALEAASTAGVHHGALHPRDVLVAPHEVRLSGLGIVEALERVGYKPALRRPYSAPERASGAPVSPAADLFSLACIAFELLTGRRPAAGGESVVADTSAIPCADRTALAEVFARALSVRPEDRHPSALAFAAALKHALTGEPLQPGADAPSERPSTRRAPRARRKTPVADALPLVTAAAAEAAPAEPQAPDGDVATAGEAEPARELPLAAAGAEPPEELPIAPPPGSTPLPSFLEAYSPAPPDADVPAAADAVAAVEAETAAEVSSPESMPAPPPEADEVPLAAPTADEPEIDRRLEATTAVAVPEAPDAEPEIPAAPPAEEPDRRIEPTMAIPVKTRRPAREPIRRDPEIEATPAEPAVQETLQLDALELDAGDHVPPPADAVRMEPTAPAPSFGGLAGEPPSASSKPRLPLVPMLTMLLVGILLGFPAGRFSVPTPAPTPAVVKAPAEEPIRMPVQPPSATPAASPEAAQAAPAGAAATAAPTTPAQAAPPSAGTTIEASGGVKAPKADRTEKAEKVETKPASRDRKAAKPKAMAESAGEAATPAAAKPVAKPAAEGKTFEGSLMIVSKPAGASVLLDGRSIGTTPISLQTVPAGSHAVRLELAGYNVWSSAVQVTAGKVNKVTASLERRPGG